MAASVPTIPTLVTTGDLGDEYVNFSRFIRSQNLSENTLYAYCGAIAALAGFLIDKGYSTDVQRSSRSTSRIG